MSEGQVTFDITDGIATVTFDRPDARNSMTWKMYDQLEAICSQIDADASVLVAVFRGAETEAFVAGTDIAQFAAFGCAEYGLRYERQIDRLIGAVENLKVPTIAVVDGVCMGGGLLIAAACDFRICTRSAVFGAPMARTLGNCLSLANTRRVVGAFGAPVAKRILMAAELVDAETSVRLGFSIASVDRDQLAARLSEFCRRLQSNAPATMYAAKETIRRLQADPEPEADDLNSSCHGSADFQEGVASFLQKRKPNWGVTKKSG